MEFLEMGLYLSAVILTLICFFVLCKNVSAIKDLIKGTALSRRDKLDSLILTGQKEKAKEVLALMIIYESEFDNITGYHTPEYMDEQRENLKRKYQKHLDALDMDFDFDTLDKIRK